jgi:hypothetical protein
MDRTAAKTGINRIGYHIAGPCSRDATEEEYSGDAPQRLGHVIAAKS